jgi:hypothetical protein
LFIQKILTNNYQDEKTIKILQIIIKMLNDLMDREDIQNNIPIVAPTEVFAECLINDGIQQE